MPSVSSPMAPKPRPRRSAVATVMLRLPFMFVLGCQTGVPAGPLSTFCPQDSSAGSGNIDKPSGVALAIKTRGDGTVNAYAISVNPDVRQARAVDLTAGLMVPAPNVYFPMAVKLGSFTQDIAVSSDGHVAVALDAQDQDLRFFGVGGAAEDDTTWKRMGDGVSRLPPRASGLAAHGPKDDLRVVVSHAGDPVGALTLVQWSNGNVQRRSRVDVGGRPTGVALSSDGKLAVVSNADGGLWVLDLEADWDAFPAPPFASCATDVRPCMLDVGGPTSAVTVGMAPGRPGDGAPLYPVALALRSDKPAVTVVRLKFAPSPLLGGAAWVERMRAPVDRVEATVMLPRFGAVVALAPVGAPACCSGVPFSLEPEALAQGGFAYAVLALVDGGVAYLDLDARDAVGRRTPRLIDTNATPPGPIRLESCAQLDVNTSPDNYREPGVETGEAGSGNRPIFVWEPASDVAGDPPVVTQSLSEDYLMRWEGSLPTTRGRSLQATNGQLVQNVVTDTQTGFDLVAAGVRPGDVVDLPPQEGCSCPDTNPDCQSVALLTVVAVAGNSLELDRTFDVRRCFAEDRQLSYAVRPRNAFTVEAGLAGTFVTRLRFFESLEVPGVKLMLLPAGFEGEIPQLPPDGTGTGGPGTVLVTRPPPRDAVAVFPLRANFEPFILDLDDTNPASGVFVPAGSIPTGLATGIAPVRVGTSGGTAVQNQAVGVLATAGGGLVMQFVLGVYPSCVSPGASCINQSQCSPLVSRSSQDAAFRFYQ